MAPTVPTSWQAIAEQVTIETDSKKLTLLIAELCSVMDADEAKKLALLTPPPQAH